MDDTELIARLRAGAASETESAAMTSVAADRIEAPLAELVELIGRIEQLNREAKAVVNPVEGRVPVSWNEVADWLEAGFGATAWEKDPTNIIRLSVHAPRNLRERKPGSYPPPENYRLLPPPGLVAAPEGMDGGGWLGQGKDVPDGWEWRGLISSDWRSYPLIGFETDRFVQCRPPAPKREPEWVPLAKLVGRTIKGHKKPVRWRSVSGTGEDMWSPDTRDNWHFFPDGTLDIAAAQVLVLAEGER